MVTIIISGHNHSGKSVLSKWLYEKNALIIECGDIVKELSLKETFPGSSCDYNESRKNQDGEKYLFKYITERFNNANNKSPIVCAIVGVRTKDLYVRLKEFFPYPLTIFVQSELLIRYSRHKTCCSKLMTYEEFIERDERHICWGLNYIKENADILLNNNNSVDSLIKAFQLELSVFTHLPVNQTIHDTATIGKCCNFHGNMVIHKNVIIGDNVSVGNKGHFTANNNVVTVIGERSVILSNSVIYENVKLGKNVLIAHCSIIRENTIINDGTYITPATLVKSNVIIGKNCRIGGIISDRTLIKNNVTSLGMLLHKYSYKTGGYIEDAPQIDENTIIGRGSIIIGGTSICKNTYIGAGAIVTKSIKKAGTYTSDIKLIRKNIHHEE